MSIRRLLPTFLVLLQAGLTAAHAHAHSDFVGHTDTPHLHACELIELFAPAHGDEGSHDESDHDADAVDLSDLMVSPTPPAPDHIALDLAPAGTTSPAIGAVAAPFSFPLGLPPSTAGPQPPLYITFCLLTI